MITTTLTMAELHKLFESGTAFFVKVDPELSKEIQLLAFDHGIYWVKEGDEVSHLQQPYIVYEGGDEVLTYRTCISISEIDYERVIITDRTSGEFTNQSELLRALLNGEIVERLNSKCKYKMIDGNIYGCKCGGDSQWFPCNSFPYAEFDTFRIQRAHLWHYNIPEHGIMCWVSNVDPDDRLDVAIIAKYNCESHEMYETRFGEDWMFATPFTKEELEVFCNNQ